MTVPKNHPHWKRMGFKKNKVWVAVDANDKLLLENGKALIKYQLKQDYEYWVNQANLYQLSDKRPEKKPSPKNPSAKIPWKGDEDTPPDKDTIRIFTDGACSGNPGPAGIGVVMLYRDSQKEISRSIGSATNNIAELEAIRTALSALKQHDKPVWLYTDSSYAVGLLTKGWKAKQNVELVEDLRRLAATFPRLRIIKVKGHAGNRYNELADQLAVKAIS